MTRPSSGRQEGRAGFTPWPFSSAPGGRARSQLSTPTPSAGAALRRRPPAPPAHRPPGGPRPARGDRRRQQPPHHRQRLQGGEQPPVRRVLALEGRLLGRRAGAQRGLGVGALGLQPGGPHPARQQPLQGGRRRAGHLGLQRLELAPGRLEQHQVGAGQQAQPGGLGQGRQVAVATPPGRRPGPPARAAAPRRHPARPGGPAG
jgi:hypothetical protein